MKNVLQASVLLLPLIAACRVPAESRSSKGSAEAQVVALVIRSEPPGAQVRVNKIDRTWITPCDIADFSIQKGQVEIELALEGYVPFRTRMSYDGVDPTRLEVRLTKKPAPAVAEAAPAPAPLPAALPAPAEAPPLQVTTGEGGTRLRIRSQGARIRVQATRVVTEIDKPGEIFLPDVPPQKAIIEFLDPRTDAVIHSVEIAVAEAAPAAPKPADVPPPALPEGGKLGSVQVASQTYGVFVKLEPGFSVQPGEEIVIVRDGHEVARTKILKVCAGDAAYPDGAVQIPKDGSIKKGDEVRRPKP